MHMYKLYFCSRSSTPPRLFCCSCLLLLLKHIRHCKNLEILIVLLKHLLPGSDLKVIFLFIVRMLFAKLHDGATVPVPFSRFVPANKLLALVVAPVTQALCGSVGWEWRRKIKKGVTVCGKGELTIRVYRADAVLTPPPPPQPTTKNKKTNNNKLHTLHPKPTSSTVRSLLKCVS